MTCSFVPPYLLRQIALAPGLGVTVDPYAAACSARSLRIDESFRAARASSADFRAAEEAEAASGPAYTVHTAGNTAELPGTPVRSADQAEPSGDVAVDEAWAGVQASLAMFSEVYGRDSYDGAGAFVSATVHYERDYDNAFWDGTQLVFGDGDGQIFDRFTKPVDVLGHEFTHAVTERTAGLVYEGQSGALNESVSDVFATCMKQRLLGQTADQGDWLIGAGLFLPGVNGTALRSMSAPGTAYDDPVLGKDPQPDHMSGYIDTIDDNGGVHLNSGIPNRAFHLAATAIGGSAAEGAGRVWYAALGAVAGDVDFAGFAAACVAAAGPHVEAVRAAWSSVGVLGGAAPSPGPVPAPSGDRLVSVRRSGGIVGRTVSGSLDLDGDDPRTGEVRDLVDRVDLTAVAPGRMHPDAFVYDFTVGGRSTRVVGADLPEDLRRLAELLLSD
ncbi:MAG: M4 family metallopeptidase [Nocardioides sp.]